ncbi:MAG: T9SS type A sorting domain-containing protein [Bacteroidota bacterium]
MRRLLIAFCLLLLISNLNAQPTITQNDMPSVGDTIWFKTTTLSALNYQNTGNNFTWDYSTLSGNPAADTFISVSSTSFTLQLTFGLGANAANLAQNSADLSVIPAIPLSNLTNFFRKSATSFQLSGFGLGIYGIGLPIKFNNADVWYKFPLTINSLQDSSTSNYAQSLLTLGYLKINRKRHNQVDGWGTLITPYGSFQTLRVKSIVHEEDSIYLDTISMGIPLIRDYIEYKWLGNGHKVPLLTVTEENLITTWKWIDNQPTVGIDELEIVQNVTVSPNPSHGIVKVRMNSLQSEYVNISLWNITGQKIKDLYQGNIRSGENLLNFSLDENSFPSGLYFLKIEKGNLVNSFKLLIER